MRFYPLGSSSFNQVYNTRLATTASVSDYALSASYALQAVTASYVLSGSPGIAGANGTCSYVAGPTGPTGDTGDGGNIGVISYALRSGSN